MDLLRRAQPDAAALLHDTPASGMVDLLRHLTARTVRVATELAQVRVTYDFQCRDPHLAVGSAVQYLLAVSSAAESGPADSLVVLQGRRLRMAITDLLRDIGQNQLGIEGRADDVLRALAHDHLLDKPRPAAQHA